MTYSELLQHPFWQQKRLRILERDKFTCRRCSDKLTTLHIHHLWYTPDTFPWDYEDDALITVCDLCHMKEEFIKWVKQTGKRYLLYHGFLRQDVEEILQVVSNRLQLNNARESAIKYMSDIKILITNGEEIK